MDVNEKIKLLAETMSGYTVIVDTTNGANVRLDKTAMPCILIFIQDTGEYLATNSHYRDSVNIRVAFLNKIPKGFTEDDVKSMRYILKQDMILFYHKLKYDFQFSINNNSVKYELAYDEMDANLIGVVFNDNIKERVGINLACETPDSIGEISSSMSFCQKVSECSVITTINEEILELQENSSIFEEEIFLNVDGSATTNLLFAPVNKSINVYNGSGMRLTNTIDYTISGNIITWKYTFESTTIVVNYKKPI